MNEGGYRTGSTLGGKVGCGVAAILGIPLLGLAMFFFLPFGDCFPNDPCHEGEGWRMLAILAVVAIVTGAIGFFIRFAVNVPTNRGKAD